MSDAFLPHSNIQHLLNILQELGYHCIGPQVRDGTIVYDHLQSGDQLPWGMRDEQSPGVYQLKKTQGVSKAFAWANGAQGIKPVLFKPRETLWRVERDEQGQLQFLEQPVDEKPIAFIGARACDIEAMLIQDKVFMEEQYPDKHYQARREKLCLIAMNCTYASANCFCVSAGTGPEVSKAYDLVMTEIEQGFIVKAGSDLGQVVLEKLALQPAKTTQRTQATAGVEQAKSMQTKTIPFNNQRKLRDLLFANLNHPRWDEVAKRCLSCGNCTSVCPTCFCHNQSDKPSLDNASCEHQREWDSCFTAGHSYLAGQPLRDSIRLRYRQWLTHKVGSWFDQFGTSGCVGCGRCVTWCPVGIDITEELAALIDEPTSLAKDPT